MLGVYPNCFGARELGTGKLGMVAKACHMLTLRARHRLGGFGSPGPAQGSPPEIAHPFLVTFFPKAIQ